MSKIKNGALDHYGVEAFEQQQFGAAGVEGVKSCDNITRVASVCPSAVCPCAECRVPKLRACLADKISP